MATFSPTRRVVTGFYIEKHFNSDNLRSDTDKYPFGLNSIYSKNYINML